MKIATRFVCLLALAAGGSIPLVSQWERARPVQPSASILVPHFAPTLASRDKATAALHILPFTFEPNVGQAKPGAEFIGRGQGERVLLTPNGIDLDLGGEEQAPHARLGLTFDSTSTHGTRGETGGLVWKGESQLRAKTNYFIGNDPKRWRTNVPHFASAQAMIPRANASEAETVLKVHGGAHGLEYDLKIPPGGRAANLRMHLAGARGVRLDSIGNLRMQVGAAEVVMLKPVVYEEIQRAAPRYTIPQARTRARGPKVRKHRSENPTAHARRQRRTRMRNKIRGGNARPPRMRHSRSDAPRRQHRPTRQSGPAPASFPSPRKPEDGEYILEADGTVGFRVGPYDANSTLVIDPSISISYSTFLGGTGSDAANS